MISKTSRHAIATFVALALAAGSGIALGQTTSGSGSSGALDSADRKFLMKAAQGNVAEVETGRLASQKAMDPQVKEFGTTMVQDHTQANEKLMTLAQQKGIQLPSEPDKMDQKQMDKLQGLSGAQFDRTYSRSMLKDHKKDVKEYEHEAQHAKDPDVKAYAQSVLPTLQHHLALAEQLPEAAGKGATASTKEGGGAGDTGSTQR